MSRISRNEPGSPEEAEAVRTTIVGGRPPGSGQTIGDVPRGVEILIKKAAVDPTFKKLLLENRARAAEAIALTLSAAEEAMLEAVPEAQLHAIVANTKVSPGLRPAFLGCAAGVMLAALGGAGCKSRAPENTPYPPPSTGINPDIPKIAETAASAEEVYFYGEDSKRTHKVNESSRTTGEPETRRNLGFGARSDRPPQGKSNASYAGKKNGEAIRLVESTPTLITGSGARDPKRSAAVVSNVFRRHLSGISGAYRAARKKNPDLGPGTVRIIITIDARGLVTSGNIASDDIGDEFLTSTILARVRGWLFPPIEQGDVSVTYPFTFVVEAE